MAVTLVNGDEYDYVGITVKLLGNTVEGITAIDYDTQQAKANNVGRGAKPVSRGRGPKTYSASITLLESEYRKLVNVSPEGDVTNLPAFPITVFKKRGTKSATDTLLSCEFVGQAFSSQSETMGNLITIGILPGDIQRGPEV